MPNVKKIELVEELSERIKSSSALYFTKYTGMSVEQASGLRQSFTDSSVEYVVSKNTLYDKYMDNNMSKIGAKVSHGEITNRKSNIGIALEMFKME